jgi:hypothetical protein
MQIAFDSFLLKEQNSLNSLNKGLLTHLDISILMREISILGGHIELEPKEIMYDGA